MAAAKKSAKTKKTKSSKKDAVSRGADQSVAAVAKQANKKRASNKGIIAIILGILILAFVAAATLGERNQQFSELTEYTNDTFSIQYPSEWSFDDESEIVNFYDGDEKEVSAAGLEVVEVGPIPGYEALEDSQRDELVSLALETIRSGNDGLKSGFSQTATTKEAISDHPTADKAIKFELSGMLEGGGEGTRIGYVIITEAGDNFLISAGGNQEVFAANTAVLNQMLESFQVIKDTKE